MPTLFNTLPVIVDEIGVYRMRNGGLVNVFEVKPNPDKEVTAFTVKGAKQVMFRGSLRFRGFDIWHESGRSGRNSVSESPSDIVEKV